MSLNIEEKIVEILQTVSRVEQKLDDHLAEHGKSSGWLKAAIGWVGVPAIVSFAYNLLGKK